MKISCNISEGNPLPSPIPSSLLVVGELMMSGFMKKSSVQEENHHSHCFVVTNLRIFLSGSKVPFIKRIPNSKTESRS